MRESLDIAILRSKIPGNRAPIGASDGNMGHPETTTKAIPQSDTMHNPCRHPRVQVVSRDEDAEFVECLECREVFDSSEFKDMDIEEKIPAEEE